MRHLKKYNRILIVLLGLIIIPALFCSFKKTKTKPQWIVTLQSRYDNDPEEFAKYWYNSEAMQNYERVKGIPQEVIIAKLWRETHGGYLGAGRWGAILGIKGTGIKGYDSVDAEHVSYQSYTETWQALSHFCDLINNDPEKVASGIDRIDRDLYYNRFINWKKYRKEYPDWKCWLLALQVDVQLSKSSLAYAACGCKFSKNAKKNKHCYETRRMHSAECIRWVEEYLIPLSDK